MAKNTMFPQLKFISLYDNYTNLIPISICLSKMQAYVFFLMLDKWSKSILIFMCWPIDPQPNIFGNSFIIFPEIWFMFILPFIFFLSFFSLSYWLEFQNSCWIFWFPQMIKSQLQVSNYNCLSSIKIFLIALINSYFS